MRLRKSLSPIANDLGHLVLGFGRATLRPSPMAACNTATRSTRRTRDGSGRRLFMFISAKVPRIELLGDGGVSLVSLAPPSFMTKPSLIDREKALSGSLCDDELMR